MRRNGAERRWALRHVTGRPHSPISAIGRIEIEDEKEWGRAAFGPGQRPWPLHFGCGSAALRYTCLTATGGPPPRARRWLPMTSLVRLKT